MGLAIVEEFLSRGSATVTLAARKNSKDLPVAIDRMKKAGASEVREEWTLPAKGFGHQATVTGTTVAHLDDTGDIPEYTEYDLLTGERTRETIALPWLKSIAHSRTESGRNQYAVTGVACLPS